MNFSLGSIPTVKSGQGWQFPAVADFLFLFGKQLTRAIFAVVSLLFGLMSHWAQAAGDATAGKAAWIKNCERCHGRPQPHSADAFSDYGTTANKLSVYASDASAITRAANEGYIIPQGNTNDKEAPGKSTSGPMGTWAGMAENRLGTGTTPTQLTIDVSAYFATLFALPESPTIGFATAGDSQASVTFTAPKSDLTITHYTVTSDPGGFTGSGTTSPIAVSGLANGSAYTFTVTATSNAGTGKASSPSNSVIPIASATPVAKPIAATSGNAGVTGLAASTNVSNAPMIGTVRAGSKQAKVFFTAPTDAALVTGYTVTALVGGVATGISVSGTKSPITVSGLTDGATYTFTVVANYNTGRSVTSFPSDAVTPLRILGD